MVARTIRLAGANAFENFFSHSLRARISVAVIETVVGQAAASLMKGLMALLERVEQIVQRSDFHVGGRAEPVNPVIEAFRIAHAQCPVRAKRGQDPDFKIGSRKPAVGREIVTGIIGGTDRLDFKAP